MDCAVKATDGSLYCCSYLPITLLCVAVLPLMLVSSQRWPAEFWSRSAACFTNAYRLGRRCGPESSGTLLYWAASSLQKPIYPARNSLAYTFVDEAEKR